MMYAITCNVSIKLGNGYVVTREVPAFYVDDVMSEEEAKNKAIDIVTIAWPTNHHNSMSISAVLKEGGL